MAVAVGVARAETGGAVVPAGDADDRADPRVGGGGADRVAAAEADPDDADPGRHPRPGAREQADRGPQVGELALAVLVRPAPAALAEAAVVEGERGETGSCTARRTCRRPVP